MRKSLLIATAWAAAFATTPVKAEHLYYITFSGYVTGSQNVYSPNQIGCNGGSPASIFCNDIGPFSQAVAGSVYVYGNTPTGFFSYGSSRTSGEYTGTIIGSVEYGLSGLNLTFARDQASGPFFQYGSAPTFFAQLVSIDGQAAPPPVPELATWAMIIVGFGAIGGAMRSRRRVSVAFS